MLTVVKEWAGGEFKYVEGPYTVNITCNVSKEGEFKSISGTICEGPRLVANISSDNYMNESGFVVNVTGLTIENRTAVNAVVDNCIDALKVKFEIS